MDTDENIGKSRTQLKKEAVAIQKMGEKLVLLSDDQLSRMEVPAMLMEAIQAVRPMKSHGARRRQMQYIGTLMRSVDTEPIEKALLEIEQGAYRQAKTFHRIERWRDQLVAGADDVVEEFWRLFPMQIVSAWDNWCAAPARKRKKTRRRNPTAICSATSKT